MVCAVCGKRKLLPTRRDAQIRGSQKFPAHDRCFTCTACGQNFCLSCLTKFEVQRETEEDLIARLRLTPIVVAHWGLPGSAERRVKLVWMALVSGKAWCPACKSDSVALTFPE